MNNPKRIKITVVKSLFGRSGTHRACVEGLGLRKIHQSVIVDATPENMGMVNKASYLLKIEAVA